MRPNIFFLLICCFQQHIEVHPEEVLRQLEMYFKILDRIRYILVQLYYSRKIGFLSMLPEDTEALQTQSHKNVASIFQAIQITYFCHSANGIGLLLQMDTVLPRQHNPKGLFLLLTINYHLAVARLEDMQWEHHTWKEYDI